MAQSTFTPIQLYRSPTASAVPLAANLAFGELAINYADGNLFFKDSSNVVRLLASTAAATGTVSSVQASGGTTGLSFTGGPITTTGTLTLAGTLNIANGGTGATTAAGARTALGSTATGDALFTAATAAAARTTLGSGATGDALFTAATAAAARTTLGATTVGGNLLTLTNPSAVTFLRFNADNTVSALDAATFRTAIGAGSGAGTVTSVQASGGTTGLTFSGGPITGAGTLTLAGTLAVANGGTGATTSTGTGAVVLNTQPTIDRVVLFAPTLGGTAGNSSIPWATSVTNTVNTQQVRLIEERVTNGTDWTTTRARLTTRIDSTDQTYIDLRTDTSTPGIAFGTGPAGSLSERMRITQGGDVLVGTTSALRRLTVQTSTAFAIAQFTSTLSLAPSTIGVGEIFTLSGTSAVSGLTFSAGDPRFITLGATPQNRAYMRARALELNTDVDMVLSVAGERMRVTTTGIGINGITSPGAAFDLGTGAIRGKQYQSPSLGSCFIDLVDIGNGNPGINFDGSDFIDFNRTTNIMRLVVGAVEGLAINANGAVISNPNRADAVGFRGLPTNAQGAGYTLVSADQGGMVTVTGNVTVPANASVAFPVGATIVIYNNSAANISIAITTDTLRLAGTATTGTRTLAQRGFATLVKVAATEWVAQGNVT